MDNLMMKSQMNGQQLAMVQSEFDKRKKNKLIMYLCWWFGCIFSLQRFYLGDVGMAFAIMLIGPCTLFIWNIIDGFVIGGRLEKVNNRIELEIMTKVKAMANSNV